MHHEVKRAQQNVEMAKKIAVKAKKECENILDEERKAMKKEIEKAHRVEMKAKKQVNSLTKIKRMSKGDMHEELFALQLQNQVCATCVLENHKIYAQDTTYT